VYKSTDGGQSWRKASSGLVDPAVSGALVDPGNPSTLYAATSAGIFRSADGGTDWTLILGGKGSVALAPSNPSRLYAWTYAGLFRSDDRGDSWTSLAATNLPSPEAHQLGQLVLAVASQPDTLFAVFPDSWHGDSVLCRSTDGGNTWVRAIEEAVVSADFGHVVADAENPSTIYVYDADAGDPGHEVPPYWWLMSTDGGTTWTGLVGDIYSGHLTSWQRSVPAIWALLRDSADGGTGSVIRSLDGGSNWEQVESGETRSVDRLLFDPRSPDKQYVITSRLAGDEYRGQVWREGLSRSTDGGATWENLTGDLSARGDINNIVVDPAPGGAIYAATEAGLFKWTLADNE
jgi:photosystem II stability/assembly factor-like uncharacterized protein